MTDTAARETRSINVLLLSVVLLSVTAAASTVLVALYAPTGDRTQVYAAIGAVTGPTVAGLLAFMIRGTHTLVNGQMAAFREELKETAKGLVNEARATGLREGALSGAASANARTDVLHQIDIKSDPPR